MSDKIQHMHESTLDYGFGGIPGNIPDWNTFRCRIFDIYIVHTGSCLADKPEIRSGIYQPGSHPYLVHDQHITVGDSGQGLIRRRSLPAHQFAEFHNRAERHVAQSGGIKKNDFHIK